MAIEVNTQQYEWQMRRIYTEIHAVTQTLSLPPTPIELFIMGVFYYHIRFSREY